MPGRETLVSRHSALDELKTIHMLEESIGPKSLRQLRRMVDDQEAKDLLEAVARDAGTTLRELDDVIHEWTAHAQPEKAQPALAPEELDLEEVLSSVIELKENESSLFRRAAEDAPTDEVRERLTKLASTAHETAERLKSLL